jgi:hypothetical protein
MNRIALALALVLAVAAACQRGNASEAPPATAPPAQPRVTDAYKADIAALCDMLKLSGADQAPEGDRMALTAMWLSQHIATQEGHDYLIAIQPLEGERKAKALDDEAHRVGLAGCALAAEWRAPH